MPIDRLKQLFEFAKTTPDDPFIQYAIALEYLKKNEPEEALKYFLELTDKHPDYVGTYYHLGKLYEQLRSPDEAIKTYEKGITVAHDAGDSHAKSELLQALDNLA